MTPAEKATMVSLLAAAKVFCAWNDAGKFPGYHRARQDELRRRWPVLAKALDELK